MAKIKLGYPFSYGDELSSQQARANLWKISPFKKEVLVVLVFTISSIRPTCAQDSFLPGAEGFTLKPSITRPQNSGSKTNVFGTQTSTGGKKNPNPGVSSTGYCPHVSKSRVAPEVIDRHDYFGKKPRKKNKRTKNAYLNKKTEINGRSLVITDSQAEAKVEIHGSDFGLESFLTDKF